MRTMILSATKSRLMLPWTQLPMQRNMIFSDAFLNIDILKEKRAEKRDRISEPGQLIRAAHKDFNANGIRNMLMNDIYRMLDDAENDEDLLLVINILKTFLKSDNIISPDFSTIVTTTLGSCLVLNSVKAANELWHDPELCQFLLGTSSHLRYMMLLYNNGHYVSLAQLAKENMRGVTVHHWTVILAALYKIGTRGAFELAKNSFCVQHLGEVDIQVTQNRAVFLYAMLAYRMGELAHAYSVLNDPRGRPHYMRLNIQLQVLIDMGRFEDALLLVRNYISIWFVHNLEFDLVSHLTSNFEKHVLQRKTTSW